MFVVCELSYFLKDLLKHRVSLCVAHYWYLLIYPKIMPNYILKYYASFKCLKKYHS